MKTKTEFLVRSCDIDLGSTFNAMRLRQRELEWQQYVWNRAAANNSLNAQYSTGHINNLSRLLGLE